MFTERNKESNEPNTLRCKINAASYENGIIFLTTLYGRSIILTNIKSEDGRIQQQIFVDETLLKVLKLNKNIKTKEVEIPGKPTVFIGVVVFLIFFILNDYNTDYLALMALWTAIPEVAITAIFLTLKMKKNYKKALRYHAAEHKAVNAYMKLGRSPTDIMELNKYSRFCKTCGVKESIKNAIPKIVLSITIFLTHDIITVLAISTIVSAILMYLVNKGFLKFLQIVVTEPPTEEELELALKGIQTFDKIVSSAILENVDGKNILYINFPEVN